MTLKLMLLVAVQRSYNHRQHTILQRSTQYVLADIFFTRPTFANLLPKKFQTDLHKNQCRLEINYSCPMLGPSVTLSILEWNKTDSKSIGGNGRSRLPTGAVRRVSLVADTVDVIARTRVAIRKAFLCLSAHKMSLVVAHGMLTALLQHFTKNLCCSHLLLNFLFLSVQHQFTL